jgi:uncharacterized protein (TIGR03435 family)
MDQTGFSGAFDIDLEFRHDGFRQESGDGSARRSAVQQLGLRLESTTGPVEMLAIHHVERPSID